MRKITLLSIVLMSLVVLSGCSVFNKKINLYVDGEEYTVIKAKNDEVVNLDILEKEDMIFIGWGNEEELHYDSLKVDGSVTLEAMYEDPNEVFETSVNATNNQIVIDAYTGVANHLKVPQFIDEMLVVNLNGESFKDAKVTIIELPITLSVSPNAFLDNIYLEEVYVYGDYPDVETKVMNPDELEELLTTYSNDCEIILGNVDNLPIVYNDSCPVRKVVSKSEVVVISGNEYFSYTVETDPNVINSFQHMMYATHSFSGAINLKVVEFPWDVGYISPDSFVGVENLEKMIISDKNTKFTVSDGIVYSKDKTMIWYYPNGLKEEAFTIPDDVTSIWPSAFYNNQVVRELIVPETYEGGLSFNGLYALENIVVEEGNTVYYVEENILYEEGILVKVPALLDLNSFTVPSDITEIAAYAFQGNMYLESLDINDVVKIGAGAFEGSVSLETIVIRDGVKQMGYGIIDNSNVNTLILEATIADNIPYMVGILGRNIDDSLEIYISPDLLNDFLNDPYWSYYDNYFVDNE
jgi:hypothetical protein